MWANVLVANVTKVLIEMRRYLLNTLSLVVTFYVLFLMLVLGINVIGDPNAVDDNVRFLLVGNAVWFLLLVSVNSIGWEITTESLRGTLEQLYMAPLAARWILLARLIGSVAVNLVVVAGMLLLSMVTVGVWLSFDVVAVMALLGPMLLGAVGLAFAVAGLALVYKQIQAFLQVFQFVLLAIAFVPPSVAPWLEFAPLVKGIDMLRTSLVEGVGLEAFTATDWASLLLNGAVYFGLGLLAYAAAERRATARGLLGRY